jgi:hypothetical protein
VKWLGTVKESFSDRNKGTSQDMLFKITLLELLFHIIYRFVAASMKVVDFSEIFWGKGGWCLGLTTLPSSCVDCLKIWEPQPPETLRACQGL